MTVKDILTSTYARVKTHCYIAMVVGPEVWNDVPRSGAACMSKICGAQESFRQP